MNKNNTLLIFSSVFSHTQLLSVTVTGWIVMSDQRRRRGNNSNGGKSTTKSNGNSSCSNNNSRESIVDESPCVESAQKQKANSLKSKSGSHGGISSASAAISVNGSGSMKKPPGDKAVTASNRTRFDNSSRKQNLNFQNNVAKPSHTGSSSESGKRSLARSNSAMQTPQTRTGKHPGSKLSRSCDKLHASAERLSDGSKKLSRQRSHGSTGSLSKPLPKVSYADSAIPKRVSYSSECTEYRLSVM